MREPMREPVLSSMVRGDFAKLATAFSGAGLTARIHAPGILQVSPPEPDDDRLRLLLSVGIHGDETAPIEMVARLLDELANAPHLLHADLMIVVGNLEAIARRCRYVEIDLNRLFPGHAPREGMAGGGRCGEEQRALQIMHASRDFFAAPLAPKWHIDLHTAIRPSVYPTFAVVPGVIGNTQRRHLIGWLGNADIGAVIVNPHPASTYSAYTATQCGATSCTAELGQVSELGKNDPSGFAGTTEALRGLLHDGLPHGVIARVPDVFSVVQELVKHSDAFELAFDRNTRNFTAMPQGALIARDGDIFYRVRAMEEYVVFPNPDVAIGKRAGLMVTRMVMPETGE